jgi:methyl-accepting chemotaxis protein
MSLRLRIISAILICAAVSIAFVATPLLRGAKQLIGEGSQREVQQIEERIQTAIQMRVNTALSMAQIVAAMPRVKRAVAKADRKGLHRLFVKNFTEVSAATGVAQFQFHTPDSHSLLRVHDPDRHSDDLSATRKSVALANETQQPVAGLEQTADGLGIRGVSPVVNSKTHAGTVEFGLSLDETFLAEVMQGSDAVLELYVLPQGGLEQAGDTSLPRITANYSGEALLNTSELRSYLETSQAQGAVTLDNVSYASAGQLINDFAGNPVALAHILVPQTGYAAISTRVERNALIASIAALLISAVMAFWLGTRLTAKLAVLIKGMKSLADGDNQICFKEFAKEKAEIGEIAKRLEVFRDGLQETETLRAAQEQQQREQEKLVHSLASGLHRIAEGDLNARITEEVSESYTELVSDFNNAVDKLARVISEIAQSANEVTASAQDIERSAEDLSRRTVTSAATLEETAAALQQITSAVADSSEGAQSANNSGQTALERASSGAAVVQDTVTAMNEINDSADEIARISTLIDDIAFQTNLLALNAGVEAARAGSAGSGFAVVAAEVRSLAQRTTEAAREIGMLTTTSSERVQQGVELVGQTGSSLDEIVAAVDHVTQQISKIAELSEEQSRGLVEINTAMRDLDSNTQRNAGMFEHSSSASQRLLTQGIRLENLVQQFQFSAPDMAPVPTDLEIETQSTRSAA